MEGMAADRRVQEQNKRFKRVTRHETTPLSRDQQVWLKHKNTGRWTIKAWVRGARPHERSFILETEAGSLFLRNRRFIKESAVGGQQDEAGAVQHSQQEQTGRTTARTGTGESQEQGPEAAQQEQRKVQGTESRRSYAEVAAGAVTRSKSKKLGLQ